MNKALLRDLKRIAQTLPARYQIGKGELSPTVFALLDAALTANELIKITVHESVWETMQTQLDALTKSLQAMLVQKIGHKLILYRENPAIRKYDSR